MVEKTSEKFLGKTTKFLGFKREKKCFFFHALPPLEIFLTIPRPERSEGRGEKNFRHFWGKKAVKTISIPTVFSSF